MLFLWVVPPAGDFFCDLGGVPGAAAQPWAQRGAASSFGRRTRRLVPTHTRAAVLLCSRGDIFPGRKCRPLGMAASLYWIAFWPVLYLPCGSATECMMLAGLPLHRLTRSPFPPPPHPLVDWRRGAGRAPRAVPPYATRLNPRGAAGRGRPEISLGVLCCVRAAPRAARRMQIDKPDKFEIDPGGPKPPASRPDRPTSGPINHERFYRFPARLPPITATQLEFSRRLGGAYQPLAATAPPCDPLVRSGRPVLVGTGRWGRQDTAPRRQTPRPPRVCGHLFPRRQRDLKTNTGCASESCCRD